VVEWLLEGLAGVPLVWKLALELEQVQLKRLELGLHGELVLVAQQG